MEILIHLSAVKYLSAVHEVTGRVQKNSNKGAENSNDIRVKARAPDQC